VTQPDFAGLERGVERRVLDGQPLERVEEFIEGQPLSDDVKAALWLVAWTLEEEHRLIRLEERSQAEIDEVHD
jgi:hypothetical protein